MKDDGSKASTSRKIIIKEVPKKLTVHSSLSSGKAGMSIDFDSFGSVGQIDKYEWDFGDGTTTSTEANPTHVFEKSGTYQVKLTVTYADGTVRTANLDMQVDE
ncbi:MAG: PKD domain-containing protein [Patescibacteria group bacterium]